jgi:hypothetical protein
MLGLLKCLLSDRSNARQNGGKLCPDEIVGISVGTGYRRSVRLVLNIIRSGPGRHDDLPRRDGRCAESKSQFVTR